MARRTTGLMSEEVLAPLRRVFVKRPGRRFWHVQPQLIVEQRRELGRHEIRRLCDREIDAWVAEIAMATHLADTHIAVPIRDRAVRREGLEADTFQSED